MTDILQGSLNSRISPTWILAGHPHGEISDGSHDSRSALASSLVGPLRSDELTVPSEDSVGGDERSNFVECAPADDLAPNGEPATLIVVQPESLLPELLLEDSVFLSEEVNDRVLLMANPSGQCTDEDLPGL